MYRLLLAKLVLVITLIAVPGCEDLRGQWQQIQPWSVGVYIVADSDSMDSSDLEAIDAIFEERGANDPAEGYRWIPLHDVEALIEYVQIQAGKDSSDHFNVQSAPEYLERVRSLVVRHHEDRHYLLVHSRPPQQPDIEQRHSLTVESTTLKKDQWGRLAAYVEFDSTSRDWLVAMLRAHRGKQMVVVVDDEAYEVWRIQGPGSEIPVGSSLRRDDVFQLRHRIEGVIWVGDDEK